MCHRALGALKVTGHSWGQARPPFPPPPPPPGVTSLARSESDGSQPGPSLRPRSPRGSAGCGHAAQRGDAALPQGHGRCVGTAASLPLSVPLVVGGGFYGKAPALGECERSRGLPPATSAARRDFCVVSSSTAAPKEKFLLRLRTPTHPSGPAGCGAAPTAFPPPYTTTNPPPPPRVRARGLRVPRVHRGCMAAAGRAAAAASGSALLPVKYWGGGAGVSPAKPSQPPRTPFSTPPAR